MKTIAAIVMMLMSGVAAAQVNKCIDKSGKVVGYGSECPAGSRSEQMQIQKAPPSATPAQKSLSERDADFRKRQVEKQEAEQKSAKKSDEAARKRDACESAQSYLKTLQAGQRVTRTDPKTGERIFLADSEYASEMAKAKAHADANCK